MSGIEPLVSVIVPTKNCEDTIERCLNSIRKQSYQNVEVILVDNASTDNTVKIASEFGFAVFSGGPERSAQVNYGVSRSRGKYAYRVDADFVLQSGVIREAVEACEERGFDAIAVHNTSDSGVSLWAKVRKLERDCYRNDELNSAARFWKRDIFLGIGGFDENLVAGEDYDLQSRLQRHGFRVGWISAEEVHVGEPKALSDVIVKHYYYGKTIWEFLKKNPRSGPRQLSPVKLSHVKGASRIFRQPQLVVSFMIYQLVRYMSALAGVVAMKVLGA